MEQDSVVNLCRFLQGCDAFLVGLIIIMGTMYNLGSLYKMSMAAHKVANG